MISEFTASYRTRKEGGIISFQDVGPWANKIDTDFEREGKCH